MQKNLSSYIILLELRKLDYLEQLEIKRFLNENKHITNNQFDFKNFSLLVSLFK